MATQKHTKTKQRRSRCALAGGSIPASVCRSLIKQWRGTASILAAQKDKYKTLNDPIGESGCDNGMTAFSLCADRLSAAMAEAKKWQPE